MSVRRGIDSHLRYFTETFLVCGSPGWEVSVGAATPPHGYAGGIVKHVETGHVWIITDEPPENWCDQKIFLGRWPD